MKKSSKIHAAAAVAVLTATTAGLVIAKQDAKVVAPPAAVAPDAIARAVSTAVAGATDFSDIVKRYGPAVVNISVVSQARQVPAMQTPDGEDPFSQLIPGWPGMPGMPAPGPQIRRGVGSGFIISSDGLILTNAHVVDGADQVTVRLNDRREFNAKVIGADRQTDVAVLRIDAKNLPTVKLGDPSRLQVGAPVLAIGSPFGFDNSASAGIVSAISRNLSNETLVPFIQTDVALNPGNSGGPLFNAQGEVVGINSAIYSRTGGYQGLSFAIPIDTAIAVQQQLVEHGKITRGRIGVAIQDLNAPLAEGLGLKTVAGALVASVEEDGPAQRAGLRVGDVIVGFDGRPIEHSYELPARVASAKPGSVSRIDVLRNGERKTLNVTIAAQEPAGEPQQLAAAGGKLGLTVRELSAAEKKQAGVPAGVLVERSGGAAGRSGIAAGDIVLSVNGKPVKDVEQLRSLVEQGGNRFAILVQRAGNRLFVPVQVG